jgi:hypothetical protein
MQSGNMFQHQGAILREFHNSKGHKLHVNSSNLEFHNSEIFYFSFFFVLTQPQWSFFRVKELISQPIENSWYIVLYFCITINQEIKKKELTA